MKDYNDKVFDRRDEYGQINNKLYFSTKHIKNIKIGNIIVGPKNFLTNPNKKGMGNTTVGHLFNAVSYENDPYNRSKEYDIVIFYLFFSNN